MSPSHHPAGEALFAYAAGTAGAGPALVLAVHLHGCRHCREAVARLEAVGGALLEAVAPAPLSAEATARAMAAIEVAPPAPRPRAAPLAGRGLPEPLHGYRIGRWRWLAPGMRWSRVEIPQDPHANVVLMRGRPKSVLPAHGHRGSEFTQVLTGRLDDAGVHYRAGDFLEADDTVNHHLRVTPEGECLCIASLSSRMVMNGWIGRIVQPLVGP